MSKKAARKQKPSNQTLTQALKVKNGTPTFSEMECNAVENARTGPVEPMIAMGIPPKRAYVTPTHDVANIVSLNEGLDLHGIE
jgi:hypothetical protein